MKNRMHQRLCHPKPGRQLPLRGPRSSLPRLADLRYPRRGELAGMRMLGTPAVPHAGVLDLAARALLQMRRIATGWPRTRMGRVTAGPGQAAMGCNPDDA